MSERGMMNFNFFGWIREGVKQSVLLGVSDAIETIGTPQNKDELNADFLAFLDRQETAKVGGKTSGSGSSKRKRLGRSLKDIDGDQSSKSGASSK